MTIKQLVKPPSLMLSHLVVPHWTHHFQVGGWPTPLKNMSSSVGMMTFHSQLFMESQSKFHDIPWFQSPPQHFRNFLPNKNRAFPSADPGLPQAVSQRPPPGHLPAGIRPTRRSPRLRRPPGSPPWTTSVRQKPTENCTKIPSLIYDG